MRRMFHVAVLVLLVVWLHALAGTTFAQDPISGAPVSGITLDRAPDSGSNVYNKPVNLTSITAGTDVFTDFVIPSAVTSSTSPSTYAIYWGAADPGIPLDDTSLDSVLLDADITNGALSLDALGNGVLDLVFPQTITNQNGGKPDLFLFDLDTAGADSWTVKALVPDGGGGYTEGAAKTFSSMGSSGIAVNFGINLNTSTNTYGVYGTGIDLGQLGASQVVGLQVSSPGGDPSVLVAPMTTTALPAPKILGATMQDVVHDAGLVTEYTTRDLVDVTIERGALGQQTIAIDDMVGANITHYRSDSQTVVLCQARGGPDPAVGQRAALLEDVSLNTAFTNVGQGSGLAAPPDENTVGIEVTFDVPVLNEPGVDVVVFDIDNQANPVPFIVSRLDADGMGNDSVEVTVPEYARFGASDLAVTVYQTTIPLSLDDLENNAIVNLASVSDWKTFAAGIDLSDLGYAEGETVSGLFFQSPTGAAARWDPAFIAGLSAVPEPSTLILLASAALGLLGLRRRA